MADTDHTLGHRFAGRQFCAKSYNFHLTDHFLINTVFNNVPHTQPGNDPSPDFGSIPLINAPVLHATLAELLETLRLHIYLVQRLPLSVQTRSRSVRIYCDIESRVKEIRLLINPVEIAATLELLEVLQYQHGPKNSP